MDDSLFTEEELNIIHKIEKAALERRKNKAAKDWEELMKDIKTSNNKEEGNINESINN